MSTLDQKSFANYEFLLVSASRGVFIHMHKNGVLDQFSTPQVKSALGLVPNWVANISHLGAWYAYNVDARAYYLHELLSRPL